MGNGCCCPEENVEEENVDERTRLLGSDRNQKSRFVDSSGMMSGSSMATTSQPMGGRSANGAANPLNDSNTLDNQYSSSNPNQNAFPGLNESANQKSENNQIFDKILNEVIHVSAFDQRTNIVGMYANNQSSSNDQLLNMVQEMPFKMKGLLEPPSNKQQFSLPDGVPAPLSVLAAQPPFPDDIRLINNVALEANNCINNFSLTVPDNVAFDFKPVNL